METGWRDLLTDIATIAGSILALAALFAVWYNRNGPVPLRQLIDEERWDDLIARYSPGRRGAWIASVSDLLTAADRFYGPRFSGQSFARCLQIALIYPAIAFLIAWAGMGLHSPGSLLLWPEIPDIWGRFWRAAALIAIMLALAGLFINLKRISDRICELLICHIKDRARQNVFSQALFIIVFILALTATVAIATAGIVASVVTLATVVAFVVLIFVLGRGGVIGFAIIAGADAAGIFIFAFFYTLLSFLNALADYISVNATRHFLARLVRTRARAMAAILSMLAVDIVIALLCLAGLVASAVLLLDPWAWLAPATLPFDWRSYWQGIQSDAFGDSLPLLLMAMTTLLPTAFHLAIGATGAIAAESAAWPDAVRMARQMKDDPGARLGEEIRRKINQGSLRAALRAWPAALIALALPLWPLLRLAGIL